MRFFEKDGKVFSFDDEDEESFYEGMTPISEAKAMEISNPQPSREKLLEDAKNSLRALRSPILDALTGIAGRAMRAGNETLATEADALADLLLDITDDPDLNAAATYQLMQEAGVLAYRRISAAASPELRIAFREITGA